MIVRNFMDHKEQVQIFVEHTVNLVMQRLSEQVGQNIGCIYSNDTCLLYTSPSPRDATLSRMPSSA